MRFFIERGEIADGAVTLSAEDSAHIGRVLRRRVGIPSPCVTARGWITKA